MLSVIYVCEYRGRCDDGYGTLENDGLLLRYTKKFTNIGNQITRKNSVKVILKPTKVLRR